MCLIFTECTLRCLAGTHDSSPKLPPGIWITCPQNNAPKQTHAAPAAGRARRREELRRRGLRPSAPHRRRRSAPRRPGGAGTAVRPVFPGSPGRRAGGPRRRREGGRAEAQGQPIRLRPRRHHRASARLRPPRPRRPRALAPPARRLAPVPSSARSRWRREGRPGCRTASCRPRSPWRPAGQHSRAGGGAEGARPGPRAAAAQAEETARGRGRG